MSSYVWIYYSVLHQCIVLHDHSNYQNPCKRKKVKIVHLIFLGYTVYITLHTKKNPDFLKIQQIIYRSYHYHTNDNNSTDCTYLHTFIIYHLKIPSEYKILELEHCRRPLLIFANEFNCCSYTNSLHNFLLRTKI